MSISRPHLLFSKTQHAMLQGHFWYHLVRLSPLRASIINRDLHGQMKRGAIMRMRNEAAQRTGCNTTFNLLRLPCVFNSHVTKAPKP